MRVTVGGTVDGADVPDVPDLGRMRAERRRRLQDQMAAAGFDALLLIGTSAVSYATGAAMPCTDSGRATLLRPVALVVAGDDEPYLFTPYPESAAGRVAGDHVLPPQYVDVDPSAAAAIAAFLPDGARLAADELTHALVEGFAGREIANAMPLLAAAKLCKTPDELACIRTAQRINEQAMLDVRPLVRPGVRQCDLSARFLRRIFELGATGNGIDPIWQVMPTAKSHGPWTTHGDVAFPTPSTDQLLREGDVMWVDTGIHYEGYASDFGRTWIVGDTAPDERQLAQFERWLAVVNAVRDACRPGVTALDLGRLAIEANGGEKPWLDHFYLAHGLGTDSAEMPMIGTDLGEAFDATLVMQPGMVLVLEPVIWEDGHAGYRSEDILAITDDGWMPLTDHPYDPFPGAG